jgi:hypothetical protein
MLKLKDNAYDIIEEEIPKAHKERAAIFIDKKKRPPVHTYNDSVYSPYRNNDEPEIYRDD